MKRVYVGMSGGVDSSVAAALLVQQGYSVTGVYMKNWTQDVAGVACPWKVDLADARAAAAVLDIPFKVFDFQAEYRQNVVEMMVSEYEAGRTPNPDVMCNQEIKFKLFLDAALADGADFIATGHYARTHDGQLLAGVDASKDQSYFLYRVTSDALSHTLFPLGEMTKVEVRTLAAELGLPTAHKPDSQGICFVGEVGIKAFLKQYVTYKPGPVIDNHGNNIGQHEGAIFYTIGQRHGLGIGGGKPYFVTRKDMANNTVYVTDDPTELELDGASFLIEQTNWINDEPDPKRMYKIRSRYRADFVAGHVRNSSDGWMVDLNDTERALSPGQSTVVYDGDRVVGGGLIRLAD